MGLFTPKPYSLDSLNIAEKFAAKTALQIAQAVDHQGQLKKQLDSALKNFDKGKLTKDAVMGSTLYVTEGRRSGTHHAAEAEAGPGSIHGHGP